MKSLKIFIALIILSASAAYAQFTKAEVQVSGLTCSMCSKATEKSLRTLNFIGDIKADLNRNVFVITFRKDAPVNLMLISKKVQDAGFFVNNLKATFNFDNVKVTNSAFSYGGDTYRLMNGESKQLAGAVALTIVDKDFAPASVYKKYKADAAGNAGPGHVYHVAI
ncbi:MAG TPA: heavy-metal-associated domain-containing protein [Mucilaginibacter sp.]|jgi:copper chaperone CopZ|nr:heavy-metal-associated domain-containing protein [Mucilaginibacter sp.]